MAGRRPGPAPAEQKRRTNVDPIVAKDGWTELSPNQFRGKVPPIPAWVTCSETARAVYADLAKLPQAALWGPGTWLELHLTLPLLDRYLSRPGSESFKAIISALGAGLSLTELDLQRARVRVTPRPAAGAASAATKAATAAQDEVAARRRRVIGAA